MLKIINKIIQESKKKILSSSKGKKYDNNRSTAQSLAKHLVLCSMYSIMVKFRDLERTKNES